MCNKTKGGCKTCALEKKKRENNVTYYFCNEQGMVAPESLIPEYCEKWRPKPNK